MKKYFIKEGYKINTQSNNQVTAYCDSAKDAGKYQADVYKFAKEILLSYNLKSVLDIGCGFALKLKEFILPVCSDIVGVDLEHAINYCRANHYFGKWYIDDINNPTPMINRKFDCIIVADVIEHLIDPDRLLDYIRKYSHKNTLIIISTPERDNTRGKNSFGPPENTFHVREWNMSEFSRYIRSRGLIVLKHFLVEAYRKKGLQKLWGVLFKRLATCQVVLCKLNTK